MTHTDDLRPLEEIRAAIQRIERALLGDLSTGSPGLMERSRRSETRIEAIEERQERHSNRILALEQRDGERARWTLRTIAERALGGIVAAVIGALAAIFTIKPPHP